MNFHIEFINFLGEIRNDTLINGKAFIFKIIDLDKKINFETVLFVHESVKPFMTIENIEYKEYADELMEIIFKKHSIKELLDFKKNE